MTDNNHILNDDQKAVLLKSLKDIQSANSQLYDWVKRGILTEEMSKILPSLIENSFSEAAKLLNYESHLLAEKEKRYIEIRNANLKISELEEKLGSNKPVDGLKEQLEFLSDKVDDWWSKDGFNHVSEQRFTKYGGLRLEFCFMLEHYSMHSKTPVSDKRTKKEHIQLLRDKGFDFADFEKSQSEQLDLIDNRNNRTLLTKMLRDRFPSLAIHKWDNRCSSNPDVFVIWHIEGTIYDLKDI